VKIICQERGRGIFESIDIFEASDRCGLFKTNNFLVDFLGYLMESIFTALNEFQLTPVFETIIQFYREKFSQSVVGKL